MGPEPLPRFTRGGRLRDSPPHPSLSLLVWSHPLVTLPPHPPTLPFLSRLKEELEKLGLQVPAQAQSKQEDGAGPVEAVSPGVRWQGTETARELGCRAGRHGSCPGSPQWSLWKGIPRGTAKAKALRLAVVGEEGVGPREGWVQGRMEAAVSDTDSHRPIPSFLESVRRKTQSCPPRRARYPPRRGAPAMP